MLVGAFYRPVDRESATCRAYHGGFPTMGGFRPIDARAEPEASLTTMSSGDDRQARAAVGLITAAGRAARLGILPCSKEMLPLGYFADADGQPRPKPVMLYLIEQFRRAGADKLVVALRSGKWDIADYLGDGHRIGLPTAYVMMGEPWGPPFTASQALPFVGDADVLYGFPDILLTPSDALARVRERLNITRADLVIGVCPMTRSGAANDRVSIARDGRVTDLRTKEERPTRGPSDWTWSCAAWRSTFSSFLAEEVARLSKRAHAMAGGASPEWAFGAVIQAAVAAGLHVDTEGGENWGLLDTGTPAGLLAAEIHPQVWRGVGAAPD